MGKLRRAGEGQLEYRTGGRGLAITSIVVGAGIVTLLFLLSGGRVGLWSWMWLVIAALQISGGAILLHRGPATWQFDRERGTVTPPRRSRAEPFPAAELEGLVMEQPRAFAPTILLLSRAGGIEHTLEVGGSLDRNAFRTRGLELAGFLGVPFVDRTA